jgi:hypothetical protein
MEETVCRHLKKKEAKRDEELPPLHDDPNHFQAVVHP